MTENQIAKCRQRLERFLLDLLEPIGRSERRHWGELYVRGLLQDGERKSIEPLVTKAPEGESRPSLSGVRLVGVVWDPGRRDLIRALVETPDGLGYYVRLNEEKFGGKVVAIERDRVRFSVREQDPGGQTRVRTVELKLN